MSVSNKAMCDAVIGKSGSGKSEITKRGIKKMKSKRIVVWSPDEFLPDGKPLDNWAGNIGGKVVRSIPELIAELKKPSFKVVFVPSMDHKTRMRQFDFFCKAVFAAKNLVCVVEELAFVTSPNPSLVLESWSMLSLRGRKMGIHLIGITQRPSHIDKNFLGNCSRVTCLALKYPADRKAVADTTLIPVGEIAKLQPLQYIVANDDQPLQYGNLTF
jgi:ABC-type dipeptide/oligopeptide/nickel transport system ATPase component